MISMRLSKKALKLYKGTYEQMEDPLVSEIKQTMSRLVGNNNA